MYEWRKNGKEEFNAQMTADTEELTAMFKESHELEKEIKKQLASLSFRT